MKKASMWFTFLILFVFLDTAQAVPGFARQTGLECFMCHTQNQTKLNSFGRNFARSGYAMSTEVGSQSLIDGKELGLSIPTVLNLSLMLKARWDKGNDVINGKGRVLKSVEGDEIGSNRGEHEIFKTSTINIAGRLSENVGGLLEFREKEGKAILGGKVIAAFDTGDSHSGFAVYSTNNYGPFSGMETYNTGLYKPLRQFENHKLTNAAQASDLGSGAATGAQVYYAGERLFATMGAYVPMHNSDGIDSGSTAIGLGRLAYELPISDMILTVGAFGISGQAEASNTIFDPSLSGVVPRALVTVEKEAYGLDLQLEGYIMDVSTLLTVNAVFKNKTTLSDPTLMVGGGIFGEPEDAHTQAYSVDLAVYPWSSLGFKVAYLNMDDKGPHTFEPDKIDAKDKHALSFGLDYSFRQNIMFTVEYSMVSPSRNDIKDYSDALAVLTLSF
jgi:hypothetical protein